MDEHVRDDPPRPLQHREWVEGEQVAELAVDRRHHEHSHVRDEQPLYPPGQREHAYPPTKTAPAWVAEAVSTSMALRVVPTRALRLPLRTTPPLPPRPLPVLRRRLPRRPRPRPNPRR